MLWILCFSFFFFQAEDGIRDLYVTGVQTCALPIFSAASHASSSVRDVADARGSVGGCRKGRLCRRREGDADGRSEERGVGKECRCRWWADQWKKKEKRKEKGVNEL